MIYKTIDLSKGYPNLKYKAELTAYCPDNSKEIDLERKRPAILIFPGGGYQMVSEREGEPVALRFLGFDICVFVLKYSVLPHTEFPYPMIEAFAATDYIHKHAAEYHVDGDKIFLMGFSAGGHLAATVGAYKDTNIPVELLGKDIKTDVAGLLLGYPVILIDKSFAHSRTYANLVSANPGKLQDFYSIDRHITPKFPRTFVFSQKDDWVIPHVNVETLVEKLKENGVEYVERTYEGNVHGFSLGDHTVYEDSYDITTVENTKDWYLDAIKFIRK